MTLLERLNSKCDTLAKSAVSRGIINCPEVVSIERQQLPLESVSLFYNGVKISGESGRELRYQIGKVEARDFYLLNSAGMPRLSIMSIGSLATTPYTVNQTCLKCGFSSSPHHSAPRAKTWVAGTGLSIPLVRTAISQMKMQRIYFTVKTRVDLACFGLR